MGSGLKERIKNRIKNKLMDICGVDRINEEIDSIYYVLNKGTDITAFPKATGPLRDYQLADTELLRIFDEACRKHQLTYWLDWGTLLGAVRHNGFIPWDDDLDVCMPRDDFNKAKTVITQEFTGLGFGCAVKNAIYIWHEATGIALDIFAVDQVGYDGDLSALRQKADRFYAFCLKEYAPGGWRQTEGLDGAREKMMGGTGDKKVCYSAIETTGRLCVYEPEDIFPLRRHVFEQYEFPVPNRVGAYVQNQYGDYMSYPRSGILHHGKEGLPAYLRAAENHEDLTAFTGKLKEISLL